MNVRRLGVCIVLLLAIQSPVALSQSVELLQGMAASAKNTDASNVAS